MFAVISMSDFSTSDDILSGPVAFPLLICLVTILISSIVGGGTCLGGSVCAASMSDGFNGAGLFKSSSKCFTHLSLCLLVLTLLNPAQGFDGDPFLMMMLVAARNLMTR